MTSDAKAAVQFLESLTVTEGPRAGKPVKLAPFQRQWVKKSLAKKTQIGILSVARGGGKSTLSAGLALGHLVGAWGEEPRRQIIIAARSRDQARIAWQHAASFAETLPEELQKRITFKRSPRLELEFEADDGPHTLTAIAADARTALGATPSLVLADERAAWPEGRGDDLEQSLVTSLDKRGGRLLMISTSAPNDQHPLSRWIDEPPHGAHVAEFRPPPGLPADDRESLKLANPGSTFGVGPKLSALEASAKRAIDQGGHALNSFRLYNRNERIQAETRDLLLTTDEWLNVEADPLPPRSGPVCIGVDMGGSASMSAAAFYWHDTGRLEVVGAFPSEPSLLHRGQADGVGSRYSEMADRGELTTLGERTVPVASFMAHVMKRVQGEQIAALLADRYKAAELTEGMSKAGVTVQPTWRGFGFKDGGEDAERFRRAVYDGDIACAPSLLMRSALADAVCLRDPSNNIKLAKARSNGRIDAVSAAVLAVAEGARRRARSHIKARAPVWA
jgi:phage terminase large subunit-like protein